MSFTGNIRVVYEEVNIRKAINEIVDILRVEAEMRGIDFVSEIDDDVPLTIWTD